MSATSPAAVKANGLSTVLDVITAPVKAFETLRIAPMWGWAFLIAVILGMIGQYLGTPAVLHAIQTSWPAQVAANPQLAAMTPAQQQRGLSFALTGVRYAWLFMPLIVLISCLVETVIMMIFNAAGKGSATFKQLWCASMNTLVVGSGVYSIVSGLVAVVRGAQSYVSTSDAMRAVPSLAWVMPSAAIKVIAFIAAFNVISIWGAVLIAIAMIHVARTSRFNAALCAILITALAGIYFAWGAR